MPPTEHPVFEAKGMPFRRLGQSGLRVSLLSLGGVYVWLTLGESLTGDAAKELVQTAFENGINTFDTAETYGEGKSELELGRVIKELNYRRSDLVIMTKIFWGIREGPNDSGLSRKHIIEGTRESLERLQMSYVDVIFAHRCDRTVLMEEIVRAFNYVIQQGWALYWGTSAWTAQEIEQAHHIATKLKLIPPVTEQVLHNMFYRERMEKEYLPLFKKYEYGTTIWSPLAGGILTGKYNDGIPEGSRFSTERRRAALASPEGVAEINKVKEITKIAQTLDSTPTALALAWLAKNPNTSTIITGASSAAQLLQNLEALKVLPRITDEHLEQIEEVLGE
ncbi:putative voltage-gated potassium channel subunit beta [Mycena venus]|uniref:Putative voltage-gated potassium channel subunit beta n=1 Tax=Mycena venus TaxID=2733690 RepID=A0A8H7CRQ0_9AGAR|nr:putative voltage-gated potassium channel subunit beta [Mycena venus]